MLKIIVLSFYAFLLAMGSFAQGDTEILTKLKHALDNKEKFVDTKLSEIEKIRNRLTANQGADLTHKFTIYNQLYDAYKSFIYDSAFVYVTKMIEVGYALDDKEKIAHAKSQLGFTLLSAGMFKEALDSLSTVSIIEVSDSLKIEYYSLMARALYDLSDYDQDGYYSKIYNKNANTFVDFGTSLADPKSYHYLYLNGLRNLRSENSDEAVVYLEKLLNSDIAITNHQYAITTSTLSYLYLKLGDTTRAINLLAEASILDIENAVKETSAMTSLAELLYKLDKVEEAYSYINYAMEDAIYYGAIQRMSQVGAILPIISTRRLLNVEEKRQQLQNLSVGLTILAILTLTFGTITFIQKNRIKKKDKIIEISNRVLHSTNNLLSESNKIKDEYLGFFFDLNSKYLDKIEQLKKDVEKKLKEHKYEDIKHTLNRTNLAKERADLFKNFDRSIVKIFPDFVKSFNSLFDAEHQIILEKDEILNTELRLFALIRIGISDSNQLASILGYSVNTIYAYKNRIKSQSMVANSEFEDRIMAIQSQVDQK